MNFELPPQPPSPEGQDQRQEKGQEAPAAAPAEQAGKRPAAPALPAIPTDLPAAEPPVIAAPPQDDSAQPSGFDPHQVANDSDRIEPEWVNKAKAVISQTRDDPYMQKHEMSKIKADYIQKRFKKQIKTDEASA
jgi:hypothetical protein